MDFRVDNHGSITVITPTSREAHEWVDYHIPGDTQWFGRGFVVEHRYVNDIVDGILADGLVIS